MKYRAKKKTRQRILCFCFAVLLLLSSISVPTYAAEVFDFAQTPSYTGSPYTIIHENDPYFTEDDYTTESFETYSELDDYGRCGPAFACLGSETMPTEDRGAIGQVKPSGWHTIKYPDIISDLYLYNRCHLIAYMLSGENANEENLITGTRYLNIEGMLPFESDVQNYIEETNNHVLYRVTPIFVDTELVARGVLMEAYSVEDDGAGIKFCVFCYNVQPGIGLNYTTGDSWEDPTIVASTSEANTETNRSEPSETTYILNKNTKKFHLPECGSVDNMADKNKESSTDTREHLIEQGYSPCKNCNP